MPGFPDELLRALAKDAAAMGRFAGLPDEKKAQVLEGVRKARSPRDVERIIENI